MRRKKGNLSWQQLLKKMVSRREETRGGSPETLFGRNKTSVRNGGKQRQHELDLKRFDRIELENRPVRRNDSYRLASAIKFVPKFESSDSEHYLMWSERAENFA